VIRHLLHRAGLHLQPQLGEIDFAALQRACDFIRRPTRSQHCDWVGGFRLVIHGQSVWLAQWSSPLPWERPTQWPQIAGDQILPIPGTLLLANGWQLSSEVVADIGQAFAQAQRNQDPFQAWVDADKIHLPFSVRSRRPGDVIQPFGMHGRSVKISDLMINQKIPRAARAAWPVVVSGAQIAWVPGLRLAEPFQLTENSRSAIRLNCR
jgi:tRNA(Ile)-lysidine synthetase-like protein